MHNNLLNPMVFTYTSSVLPNNNLRLRQSSSPLEDRSSRQYSFRHACSLRFGLRNDIQYHKQLEQQHTLDRTPFEQHPTVVSSIASKARRDYWPSGRVSCTVLYRHLASEEPSL